MPLRTMTAIGLLAALACAVPIAAGAVPGVPTPDTATNPLWRAPKVKNYLPDMTWPEVQALLAHTDMVIIPVGALEQHGPQGPIGTDFYNGTAEAQLIAQKTDVLVAPILNLAAPGETKFGQRRVKHTLVAADLVVLRAAIPR